MRAALFVLAVSAALAQPPAADDRTALRQALRQAEEAFLRRNYAGAEALLQRGLEQARRLGEKPSEAHALHGLGRLDNARGDYAQAQARLTAALAIYQSAPDLRSELARARNDLAFTEWASGRLEAATRLYEQALAVFVELGDNDEAVKVRFNLAFMTRPGPERLRKLSESYTAARAAGNDRLAGKSLHTWGDTLYTLGDLRGALEKLHAALPLLAAPGDRGDRARVLISLGRLHATHFRFEAALPYFEKALGIQREMGEKQAIVYALNSLAAAYRELRDLPRADKAGQEALRVARQTTSMSLLAGTLINHARLLLVRRQDGEALALLQEAARLHPNGAGREYLYLADVHQRAGRVKESLEAATKALERARRANDPSFQAAALYRRARARSASGAAAAALTDMRAALDLAEKLREQAGPTDYLKRGYADAWREMIAFAVELFFREGLPEEALEAAEQGRARAFVDLLATRSLAERIERPQPAGEEEEPHLASLAAIAPATAASIRQVAQSAQATVASYWVGPEAVFIWVVTPQGGFHAVRAPAGAGAVEALVRRAAEPSLSTAQPASPLPTRGAARKGAATGSGDPLRALHRVLVEPVARFLPPPASPLLVVPHGALHRLSFSSLRDARGRYLLEDYVISYLPSAAAEAPRAASGRGYLFVADPSSPPPGPRGQSLPALPGARMESRLGAQALKGVPVKLLMGAEANEAAVRASISSSRVIHFATHGLLQDQRPFESYLALGRRSPETYDDGRLTVREVYDLKLHADLVVLSTCRTAGGPVTGDGIDGMTRAFLFAGARSVLATLWDVADEPTQRLTARFYSYLAQGQPPSRALRRSQLDLLSALRRGQVRVQTVLGQVVLTENPAFWAGFVLVRLPS
jgi:CHAT domain-containing protein/tetratricopeptide (TPR) repeat protein